MHLRTKEFILLSVYVRTKPKPSGLCVCVRPTLKSGSGNRFLNEPTIRSAPEESSAVIMRPYVEVLQMETQMLCEETRAVIYSVAFVILCVCVCVGGGLVSFCIKQPLYREGCFANIPTLQTIVMNRRRQRQRKNSI